MIKIPLAEKIRPLKLKDYVGQNEVKALIGDLLEKHIDNGYFPSLILWGPPGSGKTTLARIIAKGLNKPFFEFSAVNASTKDIERIVPKTIANNNLELFGQQNTSDTAPIIFLDEIHRFNKAQQDSLLPHIENGSIIFIGATTENPSFEVINPLLSRCRTIILKSLEANDIRKVIERGLIELKISAENEISDILINLSNGDARVALNILEIAANLSKNNKIDLEHLEKAIFRKNLNFDLKGEEYYNTISALHKSMRGSDPDASLYWLARMLESGQDPLYIARRVIRFSSEDIGLADTNALIIAVSAFKACEVMGMPECNLALAEAVVYMAKAPKSNRLYTAYGKVREDIDKYGGLPVPMEIRNAPTKFMKDIGYGKGYRYEHSSSAQKTDQEYLPERIKGHKYL
jgi:putative ATPase